MASHSLAIIALWKSVEWLILFPFSSLCLEVFYGAGDVTVNLAWVPLRAWLQRKDMIDSLINKYNLTNTDPVNIFSELRRWKDSL